MQRLLVDIRRLHYKTTAGSNRGWRRSRLCGKPPLYEALDVPDRAARTQRLRQRAIQLLLKDKQ
jgi:hypothetical protein